MLALSPAAHKTTPFITFARGALVAVLVTVVPTVLVTAAAAGLGLIIELAAH